MSQNDSKPENHGANQNQSNVLSIVCKATTLITATVAVIVFIVLMKNNLATAFYILISGLLFGLLLFAVGEILAQVSALRKKTEESFEEQKRRFDILKRQNEKIIQALKDTEQKNTK